MKFELIPGGQHPENKKEEAVSVEIETLEDVRIDEERIPSKENVVEALHAIAGLEGMQESDLVVEKEMYDKEGTLLVLSMTIDEGRVRGEGWAGIRYDYILAGKHKKNVVSNKTCIMRAYQTVDDPMLWAVGGTVAECKEGEWKYSPGEISSLAQTIQMQEVGKAMEE